MPRRRRLPRHVRRFRDSFRCVVSIDGKRVYGTVRDTPEQAAADARALLEAAIPTGELWTIQTAADALLDELIAANTSAATISYYEKNLRAVCRQWPSDTPLQAITPDQIRAFIRKRTTAGVSAATISGKELQALDRLLRLAEKRGHLKGNPMRQVTKPKIRTKRFDFLTKEEVAALVERIREWSSAHTAARDADVVALAFYTGLRRAELARLHPKDVDLERRLLFVRGKTDDRTVPISEDAAEILARLLAAVGDADVVIGSWRLLEKLFQRWRDRLEEPRLKPHVMRHSFGSALAAAGVDAGSQRTQPREPTP